MVSGDELAYPAHVVLAAIKRECAIVEMTREVDEHAGSSALFDEVRDLSKYCGWREQKGLAHSR